LVHAEICVGNVREVVSGKAQVIFQRSGTLKQVMKIVVAQFHQKSIMGSDGERADEPFSVES
jgi:hypothetical protein